MNANLIDIRSSVVKGTDEKEKQMLILHFLVESKDNAYPPNYVACWVYADSAIGQILSLSLLGGIPKPGSHYTDVRGLGMFDVAYKFDKTKKLQRLTYCKVKED